MKEKIIEEVKSLIAAPSCCAEAREAAENWLKAVGTEDEAAMTEKLVAELKEDVAPIERFVAFAGSQRCAEMFGDGAKELLAHAKELEASGAKYCDCAACTACVNIIEMLK